MTGQIRSRRRRHIRYSIAEYGKPSINRYFKRSTPTVCEPQISIDRANGANTYSRRGFLRARVQTPAPRRHDQANWGRRPKPFT
jgi:hypothetical protein